MINDTNSKDVRLAVLALSLWHLFNYHHRVLLH